MSYDGPVPCPADVRRGEDDRPLADRTCGEVFSGINGAIGHAALKEDADHPHPDRRSAADELGVEKAGTGGRPPKGAESDSDPREEPDFARQEPFIPEAQTAAAEPVRETADCPECGADTNHTESEIADFIQEHGAAYCSECEARLRVVDA